MPRAPAAVARRRLSAVGRHRGARRALDHRHRGACQPRAAPVPDAPADVGRLGCQHEVERVRARPYLDGLGLRVIAREARANHVAALGEGVDAVVAVRAGVVPIPRSDP